MKDNLVYFTKYSKMKPILKPNKALFRKYEVIALNLIKGRHKAHISSKAVFELLRITGDNKLNNDLSPSYSREFVRKYPGYKKYFEFRQIKIK